MSSVRNILSYTFLLSLLTPSLTAHPPQQNDHRSEAEAEADIDAFQKLLNQADPPALHAALHDLSPKEFKHGVFPEDRTAVEAIHREEPGIATGILKIANLAKRQNNATAPATTPLEQTPESDTVSETAVVPGVEPSSTAAESPTITPTTGNTLEENTITSAPTTTSGPEESSPTSASLTQGQVITTTNAVGLTIISTIGGGATTLSPSDSATTGARRSASTSTLMRTSTLPDGQQSVVTAVTVVGGADDDAVDTPTGTAGVGATGTGSGQPGLQTGEAVMTRGFGKEMAVVFGAAVGVAILL